MAVVEHPGSAVAPDPDAPAEPHGESLTSAAEPGLANPTAPRSRRAVIAGALGGVAGLVAGRLAAPSKASAAAGSPLIVGSETNNAGTSDTQLIANSNVVTFKLYQQGPGTALMGYTTTASGTTRGVYGRVDSPNGDGLQGRNGGAAGTGAAIRAYGGNNNGVVATTDAGTTAIHATHNGPEVAFGSAITASGFQNVGLVASSETSTAIRATSGTADGMALWTEVNNSGARSIFARNYATSGVATAVEGYSDSSAAKAVVGTCTSATGVTYALYGTSPSTSATVVAGIATAGSGSTWGVYGQVASTTGTAVLGSANAATGVNYGVRGTANSAAGFGVYSVGNMHVTGTLSKSAGTFVIDHPQDPAGKILRHSFVESPDMKNVYDGVATTNAAGRATVALPGYFEALNRDFRYQLTPIGAHAPVYIEAEVANGRFVIAGANAGQRISWQVTGVRQDAYATKHPVVVEEAKAGEARGRYLNPELFGQPASKHIHRTADDAKEAAAG